MESASRIRRTDQMSKGINGQTAKKQSHAAALKTTDVGRLVSHTMSAHRRAASSLEVQTSSQSPSINNNGGLRTQKGHVATAGRGMDKVEEGKPASINGSSRPKNGLPKAAAKVSSDIGRSHVV